MRANSDLFYIATIGISIAYRGVSGLAHRPLTNHNPRPLPAEDDTEYLLVHNARRFCEGGTILEAACEKPLEHAIKSCADTGECTFLCHTAKKPFARRNASDTEPQESDAGIPNSSATWLCSGSGWTALYPKNGWITAIKGSVVRNLCKAFTVWLNQTAECPKGNTIDIARDLTPDEASLLCTKTAGCTFFTMSLESHDSSLAFGTLTHFCRGMPTKRVARDGHFLATTQVVAEEITNSPAPKQSTTRSRIAYYFGGPLTNDAYYDDKTPGSLVPATRL